jgi:hypothetical protein
MAFILAEQAGCTLSRFVTAKYLNFELFPEMRIVSTFPIYNPNKYLICSYLSRTHPF